MAAIAEFEEKEFECPLNGQLNRGGKMWPPGQVLEQVVGFDAALFVDAVAVWAHLGVPTVPGGRVVLATWWPGKDAQAALSNHPPPPFKLNVFLQYKRPEHLAGVRSREWKYWKAPYFRFYVTTHQQVALEACADALGTRGLVAYASPAFYKRANLFSHVEKGTLVTNTHFVKAALLKGHGLYTYATAVGTGRAYSKPVEIAPIVISAPDVPIDGPPIDGPPPEHPSGGDDGFPPEELLLMAEKAALSAVHAVPDLVGSRSLFEAAVQRAERLIGTTLARFAFGEVPAAALHSYIVASTFTHMAGIGWRVARDVK